jgi:hypothetical protein
MAARRRGVNETGQGQPKRSVPYSSNLSLDLPIAAFISVYLWIHFEKSLVVQIDGINHADDGGVDGRVGPANGGHGGKALRR